MRVSEALELLNLQEGDLGDLRKITRSFRLLALENHPDRLRAMGRNPEELALAEAKMGRLNAAYLLLRERVPQKSGPRRPPPPGTPGKSHFSYKEMFFREISQRKLDTICAYVSTVPSRVPYHYYIVHLAFFIFLLLLPPERSLPLLERLAQVEYDPITLKDFDAQGYYLPEYYKLSFVVEMLIWGTDLHDINLMNIIQEETALGAFEFSTQIMLKQTHHLLQIFEPPEEGEETWRDRIEDTMRNWPMNFWSRSSLTLHLQGYNITVQPTDPTASWRIIARRFTEQKNRGLPSAQSTFAQMLLEV